MPMRWVNGWRLETQDLTSVKSFGWQEGRWFLCVYHLVNNSSPWLGEVADSGHWQVWACDPTPALECPLRWQRGSSSLSFEP